ncbi:uncharacterized protein [Physcomitrium patens]|uniref:Stress enhanced protein 1 n=1 Tax=Physcomitrium patens TaxID=3218 RepID=A0A2K1L960_PHYPA|nr:stress enhanced protein 1, chloroplastic-like isoform X2 [Physcomitrium patens]PNR62544.1 hypothetical protein PHYPA_000968 [Physcomitrium patens]|eukprot:XP_024372969.1 stress enhanced protein 1, chloroplastic-like isoform X2 [Physcomitrella patens]
MKRRNHQLVNGIRTDASQGCSSEDDDDTHTHWGRRNNHHALTPSPLPSMAKLLISAPAAAASPCLGRASLGLVAQRNVNSIEYGVGSMAGSCGRLSSSASCQMFGSSELAWKASLASRRQSRRAHSMNIRCDQSTEGGNRRSLDTWIGRFAMLGFVAAIGIEISSGKGVLESAGLPVPVPPVVLGLISLVGIVTAWNVFQSPTRD